ncbi:putative abhydrolase domain-containing protein [Rosellinia necatrix]|uniref:Putative abhydrolase domain-containing protein n=1 Tax=Rosellinia necatrix TaxID=77044 RepID=A0A1W2THN0_ROSNE|nr:putative abhydrolase domain-containing protein [Rosellinia necatrix]
MTATRCILTPGRFLRPTWRAYSSSPAGRGLQLVFDHHAPPNPGRDRQDAPIIFMHGLFGSKKNNRSVSKVLARDLKRHVYAIDLRNHGESPHASRHDYLAMAEDVAGFIGEHGLKEPTLIGHSMGAKTAMALALDQPALISDIVSVDNAPLDATLGRSFAGYIRGMRHVEDARVSRLSEADSILAAYEPDIGIRQFLLGNLYRTTIAEEAAAPGTGAGVATKDVVRFRIPLDILAKNLDNMGDFPFRDPDERRFEKPALFVRGSHSKYVPDEAIPVIGRFFPRFSLVDVEAGHWLISEKPADFLKTVIEFLTPKE